MTFQVQSRLQQELFLNYLYYASIHNHDTSGPFKTPTEILQWHFWFIQASSRYYIIVTMSTHSYYCTWHYCCDQILRAKHGLTEQKLETDRGSEREADVKESEGQEKDAGCYI